MHHIYLAQYGSSVGFPSLEKKPGNSTPSQNSVQQEWTLSVGALGTTEEWKQNNTNYRQKVFYATSSIQNLPLEQWSTFDSKEFLRGAERGQGGHFSSLENGNKSNLQ